MARPLWEVADVIRMAGSKLWERLGETLSCGDSSRCSMPS